MTKRVFLLFAYFWLCVNIGVHAQLSTNEKPVSFSLPSGSLGSIDSKRMPMLDMENMITGTVPLITDPTCFKIAIPFQFTKTFVEK